MDRLPRQLIYLALNNRGMCRLFLIVCYVLAVILTGTLTCDILIVAMHVVFETHAPYWRVSWCGKPQPGGGVHPPNIKCRMCLGAVKECSI